MDVLLLSILLAQPAAEHTKDSLKTVKKILAGKKAVLLDVREQSEWDDGHIKGAVLLPLSRLREGADAKQVAEVLPKDRIVYCHCGKRVLPASVILNKLGYDVRPLKAGYKDLLADGFPKADK